MKKYLLPTLVFAVFCGCSSDNELVEIEQQVETTGTASGQVLHRDIVFPEEVDAVALPSDAASALSRLVLAMDVDKARTMGETADICTNEEFAEIKAFVDANLVGATDTETFNKIFDWIRANILVPGDKETAYLRPYEVFTYKKCVCQGYANLLKTMLLTQDIPCFIANGMVPGGGHAWNYAYYGGEWWVVDPTWGRPYIYKMTETGSYSGREPQRVDIDFYEDDSFVFGFKNNQLCVNIVKETAPSTLVLPREAGGFVLTCFDPDQPIPMHVSVLGIPKNITTLCQYTSTLREYTPGVEEIYVEDGHKEFTSYKGIVYLNGDPYFFPAKIKKVELKKKRVMDKGSIYDLPEVVEIVIPEGVSTVKAYAIENCPKLKYVYLPEKTRVEDQWLYRCPADVQVVTVPTGIDQVTM